MKRRTYRRLKFQKSWTKRFKFFVGFIFLIKELSYQDQFNNKKWKLQKPCKKRCFDFEIASTNVKRP